MPTASRLPLPWAGSWADAVHDPDAALLRRFAADRNPAAFAVLARRHGPLVFGVCLRVAGQRQDAEDAFQAVFLILAQKAGTVANPDLLGNWLYGVAYRVAGKARRAARRRQLREAAMAHGLRPGLSQTTDWADAAPVIDEELARLADHYRTAVLLCDVQGLSRADAAARLGIAEGTLSSRLNAGRKKLAERLTRRGVTLSALSGAAVGGLLADHTTAAVPDDLTAKLSAVLQHFTAGDPISGPVGDLTREGWTMRAKLWAGLAAVGLSLGAGATFAAWPGDDKPKSDPPKAANPDDPKPDAKPGDKPAKPAKPKLIDTIEVNSAMGSPFWGHYGNVLYVSKRAIPERGTRSTEAATRTPIMFGFWAPHVRSGDQNRTYRTFEYPASGFLGFFNDDKAYATYSAAGKRINAPDLLLFHNIDPRDRDNPKTTRVEIDPDDGRPFAVSPDGKTVFAEKTKSTGADLTVTVNLLDAKTGELARTLGTFGGEGVAVRGYKLSHAADRLFVYLHGADYVTVECIDVATGKSLWDWRTQGVPRPERQALAPGLLVPSRDGKRLAVIVMKRDRERGTVSAIETRVLDATTGKSVAELQVEPDRWATGLDFSHDGRLLVGKTTHQRNRELSPGGSGRGAEGMGSFPGGGAAGRGAEAGQDQLVVWDLKTGKVLRAWDDQLQVEVAFAPDRPVLAIVEREREVEVSGPMGGGNSGRNRGGSGTGGNEGRGRGAAPAADPNAAATPTVTYKSTIGFWDLSPLLK